MTGKIEEFQVKEDKFQKQELDKIQNNEYSDDLIISDKINKIKDETLLLIVMFSSKNTIYKFINYFGENTINLALNNLSKINRYIDIEKDLESKQTNKEHVIGILYLYSIFLSINESKIKSENIFNIDKVYLTILMHNLGTNINEHEFINFDKQHDLNIANILIKKFEKESKNYKGDFLKSINQEYIEHKNNINNPEIILTKIFNDVEKFLFLLFNYKNIKLDYIVELSKKILILINSFEEKYGLSIFLIFTNILNNIENIKNIEEIKEIMDKRTLVSGVKSFNIKK